MTYRPWSAAPGAVEPHAEAGAQRPLTVTPSVRVGTKPEFTAERGTITRTSVDPGAAGHVNVTTPAVLNGDVFTRLQAFRRGLNVSSVADRAAFAGWIRVVILTGRLFLVFRGKTVSLSRGRIVTDAVGETSCPAAAVARRRPPRATVTGAENVPVSSGVTVASSTQPDDAPASRAWSETGDGPNVETPESSTGRPMGTIGRGVVSDSVPFTSTVITPAYDRDGSRWRNGYTPRLPSNVCVRLPPGGIAGELSGSLGIAIA